MNSKGAPIVCPSTAAIPTEGGSYETDIDFNSLLVDETSSDDSDEIAVFDSRDLSLLNDERKALCEDRLYALYKTFRNNGPEYRTRRTVYGFASLDVDFIDNVQKKLTIDFDEEEISKAVILFHVDEMGIRQGATRMEICVFDFIVLLMDHIWKERDKTIENYSISRVAGYLGVDRAHLRMLGNLVNSKVALTPTEIAVKTLCEPIELIVMLTMLVAQMHNWPVAKDFGQKWKAIETAPIPSDEEAVQSLDDFVTITREVLEDFEKNRTSPPCDHINDNNGDDLVMLSNELVQHANSILIELRNLPPSGEILPRANILLPEWIRQAEMIANGQRLQFRKESGMGLQTADQNRLALTGEEISVVSVTPSEHSQRSYVVIDDPVNISDIPNGTFCLARQQKAYNFVRCQIVEKVSPREYNVLFGDGSEEIIDISRIARKIEGRLRMWEGVRVCALYEPKLRNERLRKAFYSGIVGVGPHGFSQDEMLIFFDNGTDSFVHERTVYMLAEQKCKLHNCKEEIDRRNNWCLVPPSRQKFIKHYLKNFPDWPLVPMKRKENTQRVNIHRNGKPHSAYVLRTERQFALLRFMIRGKPGADCVATPCNRHNHMDEWIYRGSERLEAIRQTIDRLEKIERQEKTGIAATPMRSRREARLAHCLEYALPLPRRNISNRDLSSRVDLCPRGRALLSDNEPNYQRLQTARKRGIVAVQHVDEYQDYSFFEGRVLRSRKEKNITFQDIPNWNNLRQVVHSQCTTDCLQCLDKDPYDKGFLGCSPYMIPLLVGWTREIATLTKKIKVAHCRKTVGSVIVYRTPCGISIYNMDQVAKYLKETCSRLTIDLFTFNRTVRPNVIYRTPDKAKLMNDFTNGYEAIPVPVYNEVDDELPPKVEYDPRRYPYNKETDVSSISVDFCAGCTCTDDCSDETRCECRLLTKAEVLRLDKSLRPSFAEGYMYRNLALGGNDESYLSGLYECNEKCGCSRSSCHNRVVQQQIKIPLERGDEYFADVNLVDNVEKEKLNAGVDLGDPNDGYYSDEDCYGDGEANVSSDNESFMGGEDPYEQDDDYYDSGQDSSFSSEGSNSIVGTVRTRKRRKRERESTSDINVDTADEKSNALEERMKKNQSTSVDLDYACSSLVMMGPDIFTDETESNNDDSTVRETELAGPPKDRFDMIKYIENMGLPSLYTIDAKRKGNIGRFFNHSCEPNVRTQLVYVDTHDFRLPWIAFFTTKKISAGSELFWDYGYSEGTVDGKQLECFCGSRFCRKRLL